MSQTAFPIASKRILPLLVLPLALAACTPVDVGDQEPCRADCRLDIELPSNIDKAPKVPPAQETWTLAAGVEVDVWLPPGPDTSRTVLVFKKPAFVDGRNRPLHSITLHAGKNKLKAISGNACPVKAPCKYWVVNVGRPERPALDPRIIIHQ